MCDYCHDKAADDFIARFRPGSEGTKEAAREKRP
jgi:hypothetical protein